MKIDAFQYTKMLNEVSYNWDITWLLNIVLLGYICVFFDSWTENIYTDGVSSSNWVTLEYITDLHFGWKNIAKYVQWKLPTLPTNYSHIYIYM